MGDAEEFYDAIVAANLEVNKLLIRVVEIVSVHHPSASSNSPDVAFSEILSTCIPQLKKAADSFATDQLFTSTRRDQLIQSIDIKSLDNSLLLNILLKIEKMLYISNKPSSNKCQYYHHKTICCGDCNVNCDHSSPSCIQCLSSNGNPSKKCKHECKNCKKTKQECDTDTETCCATCNLCIMCNKQLSEIYMSNLTSKAATTIQKPCKLYFLCHCLKIFLKLRNLYGHVTVKELKDFIDGTAPLRTFEMYNDQQEFFTCLEVIMSIVLEHFSNSCFGRHKLTEDECSSFKDNFNCICIHGKSLEKYLAENKECLKDLLEKFRINKGMILMYLL